jgi:uncharacterized protein (TIGR02996 family)
MTEQEVFLERIRQDPKDDTVRLVYADWLDEHGEPDRAKFIRFQIERSKVPPETKPEDDTTLGLLYDARDLLDTEEGHTWWPDYVGTSPYFKVRAAAKDLCWVEYERESSNHWVINQTIQFRRGFVYRVTINLEDLLGGCACQRCDGRRRVLRPRQSRPGAYKRVKCPECGGTGRWAGLAPFLRANPVEKIYFTDLIEQVELEPPGPDYKWQAYWYDSTADSTAYNSMTGGHSLDSLWDEILKWAAGRYGE